MNAYVIGSYNIDDPAGYEGYVPGVLPLIAKHGGEVLVADFEPQRLEGQKRGVYCVLRFPSEEAVHAWFNDPAYEPVKSIRHRSCSELSLILAKELVPQGA